MRHCYSEGTSASEESENIWKAWHPLAPPATSREPDEVRGAEIELEISLLHNVVPDPDLTVHASCREKETRPCNNSAENCGVKTYGDEPRTADATEAEEEASATSSPPKPLSQPEHYVLIMESIFIEGVKDSISELSTCWLEVLLRKPEGIAGVTKTTRILWPRVQEPHVAVCFGKAALSVKASDLAVSHVEVKLCRRLEGHIKYVFGKAKSKPLNRVKKRDGADVDSDLLLGHHDSTDPVDPSLLPSSSTPLDENDPEFMRITMRRQAAFKRNVKIKVGSVAVKMYLAPVAEKGSGWNQTSMDADAEDENDVEIEDFLQVFQDKVVEGEAKLSAPQPLELVTVEGDVGIGINRLSVLLLSENSRFVPAYNRATGNTEVSAGAWQTSMDSSRSDSFLGGSMQRAESVSSTTVEESKLENEEAVMPSRVINFKPTQFQGARSEELQTITTMVSKPFRNAPVLNP